MTDLVFGEVKVVYDNKSGTANTVDVAKILEAKYGLFTAFYTLHENDIKQLLIDSLAGALENLHMGGVAPANPFDASMQKLQSMFRKFLYTGEVERMGIEGVPTQAALDGVKKMAADVPGVKNVWLKKIKVQPADFSTVIAIEFESKAAFDAYTNHPAHKAWEAVYLPVREESTTHDVTN